MRTLIADAIVAMTGLLVRWVDPSAVELHLTRSREPLGAEFRLPALINPCRPRELVSGYDIDTFS